MFTRGVCDELLSFFFFSRSTYTAATSHFTRTKKSFSQCRQNLILLGSVFVSLLETPPETFRCPTCGDDPAYIIIDGQALGFKRRQETKVVRPALLVPPLGIDVELLCMLPTAILRRAVRKILKCSDALNQSEMTHLCKWLSATAPPKPRRGRRSKPKADINVHAATIFSHFFPAQTETGADVGPSDTDDRSGASSTDESGDRQEASFGPAAKPKTINNAGDADAGVPAEPVASTTKPWHKRSGVCAPASNHVSSNRHMQWSAVRTFLLALFGDPVVGLISTVKADPVRAVSDTHLDSVPSTEAGALLDNHPIMRLAAALQMDDATLWHQYADAADSVDFFANFLGRLGGHLNANKVLRHATEKLLEFAVRLESIVDDKFKEVAAHGSQADTGLNEHYCSEWGGIPTPDQFKRFATNHPAFKSKDLDSIYSCFEYFGCLPRVQPAIFSH